MDTPLASQPDGISVSRSMRFLGHLIMFLLTFESRSQDLHEL